MTDVTVINRTEFRDQSKGPPGVPTIMVTFQLSDMRVGSAVIPKAAFNAASEKAAIRSEIERMGRISGEVLSL